MTGNELARSLALPGNVVIGFDNFYASSIDTVADILDRAEFIFHEWDLDSAEQMRQLEADVRTLRAEHSEARVVYILSLIHISEPTRH